MLPRFLAPDLTEHATFALPPDESRHAARVLRLRVGDEALVFDGRGRQVRAAIERVGRDAVLVRALGPAAAAAEPRVPLTLLQAVIKTVAMDRVVRDATMMGVGGIRPLVSAHANATVDILARRRSVGRWRRVAVSAAKQCGRAVVPDVLPPLSVDACLQQAGDSSVCRIWLVEPACRRPTVRTVGTLVEAGPPRSAVLAVGPEGGWSAAEVEAAEAGGFLPIGLGGRVLRADAVSLAAIALLQFVWGDL